MANKGGARPAAPSKGELSAVKKDRLLGCLVKLNDRDTQKRAAEELGELLLVRCYLATCLTLGLHMQPA